MPKVAVQIVRFVDDHFPGWVECELVDAVGRRHTFKDKVPMFTVEDLDAQSKYPTPGIIACEVVDRWRDQSGQELVRISTAEPYGIESTEGLSVFTVSSSLVSSSPDGLSS